MLVLFAQSTSQLWLLGNFYANRDFFAKNLCVSRNEPQSACKGSCQLKKQMDNEAENQNLDKNTKEANVYFQPLAHVLIVSQHIFSTGASYSHIYYHPPLAEGHLASVFHPPLAIV
jgi:hypothetical protein